MSEATVLFRARHRGEPVTISLATEADMSRLAASVACVSDLLGCWSLISVRSPSEVVVHAVGWPILLAQPWASSGLTAYDKELGGVRAGSRSQYSLGTPGPSEIDAELRAHISSTLRRWGFRYVWAVAPKLRPFLRGRKRHPARSLSR